MYNRTFKIQKIYNNQISRKANISLFIDFIVEYLIAYWMKNDKWNKRGNPSLSLPSFDSSHPKRNFIVASCIPIKTGVVEFKEMMHLI